MRGLDVAVSKPASSNSCGLPVKAQADLNQATHELLDGRLGANDTANLAYAPNSQSSSSDESLMSQESQPQRISQDTSQSSLEQAQQPPSSSAPSHERPGSGTPSISSDRARPQDPPLTAKESNSRLQPALPALDVHGGLSGEYHADTLLGQKRTASGHVKSPGSSLATSPVDAVGKGHSRNASSNTQIGEVSILGTGPSCPLLIDVQLSAQLKTRLSYAMVKVQNGWETRTIDEVESLAATQGCITSPRQPFSSPRKKEHQGMAGFQETSPRSTAPSASLLSVSSIKHQTRNPSNADTSPRTTSSYSPPKRHQSYFSHPQHAPHYAYLPASTGHGPSLAPPVDLVPRGNARQSHQNPRESALHQNGPRSLSNLSASSTSSLLTDPLTPPRKRLSPIRTPNATSNATAMEKDAIETLLFLSSPGNSQREQAAKSQLAGTPLRSTFVMTEKHVGFADDDLPVSPRKRGLFGSVNLATDENIDKVLEQMAEVDSSSSDDDI
ncbi:hypothetical protein MMC13_006753 [Lambiella insularis]|nr:hypothetical protein [Lambiella insularis]